MKKCRLGLLGLTLTSVVAIASANAADMYRAAPADGYKDGPVYVANTWTGFYVGVNGGYGWDAKTDHIKITDVNGNSDTFAGPDRSGGFGGGQIGYNWQRGRVVFGIEADIQGSGISDDLASVGTFHPGAKISSSLDYFGTVRGRLGYSFDRALVYATGGFAYGAVKQHVFYNDGATITFDKDATETGYTVGGGVEYALNPNWSIKGEYQFISLESDQLSGVFNTKIGAHLSEMNNDFHTVRVGLNYHVGQGYEPLK